MPGPMIEPGTTKVYVLMIAHPGHWMIGMGKCPKYPQTTSGRISTWGMDGNQSTERSKQTHLVLGRHTYSDSSCPAGPNDP